MKNKSKGGLDDLGRRDLQLLIDPAAQVLVEKGTQFIVLVLQAVHICQIVGPCGQQAVIPLKLLVQCVPHA